MSKTNNQLKVNKICQNLKTDVDKLRVYLSAILNYWSVAKTRWTHQSEANSILCHGWFRDPYSTFCNVFLFKCSSSFVLSQLPSSLCGFGRLFFFVPEYCSQVGQCVCNTGAKILIFSVLNLTNFMNVKV